MFSWARLGGVWEVASHMERKDVEDFTQPAVSEMQIVRHCYATTRSCRIVCITISLATLATCDRAWEVISCPRFTYVQLRGVLRQPPLH